MYCFVDLPGVNYSTYFVPSKTGSVAGKNKKSGSRAF